ncbi:DUF192 domain-containing protein [Roseospira visakhapatnamensis]|uniref:DUF192 domain-containing protein n=1 Tax=Roseospira visakhapatnamensis TaxID=390880 RepID=A0A7W6WA18_9PROT|nr:DUF192 domain-containing protein [Roseospira visakhapatnamensis]MBB4266735.1 hypothetical protein [Roseospira visakhapatnamensis]
MQTPPRPRPSPGPILPRRALLRTVGLGGLAPLLGLTRPAAAAPSPIPFPTSRVAVVTHDGRRYVFTVEVARTPTQRARGLMYRRRLAPDHGMLFDFGGIGARAMWMKNTYVALDILFLENDGRIWSIAAETTPLSEAILPAQGPIRAALELNAGTCRLLGIEVGDVVEHPLFGHPPVP